MLLAPYHLLASVGSLLPLHGSTPTRPARVLELLDVNVVAHLEVRGEPPVEEDAQANTDVEVELRLELKVAVVRVDDGDRPRVDEADAPDQICVVVEDELPEACELSVHGDVREIEVRPLAVLVQRRRDASRSTDFEVEVGVLIQATVEVSVETDGQDVGDVEVDVEARPRVADELVIQRYAPVGLELEAVVAERVDLLDGVDLRVDVLLRGLSEVPRGARLGARRRVDVTDTARGGTPGRGCAPVQCRHRRAGAAGQAPRRRLREPRVLRAPVHRAQARLQPPGRAPPVSSRHLSARGLLAAAA